MKKFVWSWTYMSLPDALWTYSFTSFLIIIWHKQSRKVLLWIIFPILFSVLMEIFQLAGLCPGTFDVIDLLLCIFSFLFNMITLKTYHEDI